MKFEFKNYKNRLRTSLDPYQKPEADRATACSFIVIFCITPVTSRAFKLVIGLSIALTEP